MLFLLQKVLSEIITDRLKKELFSTFKNILPAPRLQYMPQILILYLIFLSFCFTKEPPIFNFSFLSIFQQTNYINKTPFTSTAEQLYDPINNRQRFDFQNGQYDRICGAILPNVTTPCQHYAVQGKRWIVFPYKYLCCFCCDSQHGCGPIRPDWLTGAEYLGEETILGVSYDKWNKVGSGYNYFWADKNGNPRKIDEGGKYIKDYLNGVFTKRSFEDSAFALPPYCSPMKNCLLQSPCGTFRLQ